MSKTSQDQKRIESTMDKARQKIEHAITKDGPYSHNIISITLIMVAKELGYVYSNDLIREFDLSDLYGIQEEETELK